MLISTASQSLFSISSWYITMPSLAIIQIRLHSSPHGIQLGIKQLTNIDKEIQEKKKQLCKSNALGVLPVPPFTSTTTSATINATRSTLGQRDVDVAKRARGRVHQSPAEVAVL